VVEPSGKHYHAMRTAVWLYLYLLIHADRRTGKLYRLIDTIAHDMGVKPTTIRRWLMTLARNGYVTRTRTGRALNITIERWKALQPPRRY
jgi:DNA-binding PadR family transcriptional regulator